MSKKRPLIGCTTYRKEISENPYIRVDGLMPTYTEAILAAGGLPMMIPLALDEEALSALLERLDGLLLPGGGDIDPDRYGGEGNAAVYGINPVRDEVELFLARQAISADKPVFAICRGHQVLNVAQGGSLWEDVLELMPDAIMHAYFRGYERNLLTHAVTVQPNSHLSEILGTRKEKPVNSIHHQGIRELGRDLVPTAYAPDGLIEGIEVPGHRFAVGVQWHPEEFVHTDTETLALFAAFVDACK